MSMIWFGTSPRVNIMDPELVKEVLSNKSGHFEKLKQHPFVKLLATGVATYNGEKWVNHRRLLSPAFHQEKLKVLSYSCLPNLRFQMYIEFLCKSLMVSNFGRTDDDQFCYSVLGGNHKKCHVGYCFASFSIPKLLSASPFILT